MILMAGDAANLRAGDFWEVVSWLLQRCALAGPDNIGKCLFSGSGALTVHLTWMLAVRGICTFRLS